jgi:hypothetical protein
VFEFLKARRERAEQTRREEQAALDQARHAHERAECIQLCERELERTRKALAAYANSPRDLAERGALLARAKALGLGGQSVTVRLEFLQRLLTALSDESIQDDDIGLMELLIAEGENLELGETNGVQILRRGARLAKLRAYGPVAQRDENGRAVYASCNAEYRNTPGSLEVSEAGLTFAGEVRLEIAWSNVVHLARTTHTYQGLDSPAVAVQEQKRRTATKFVFSDGDAEYSLALVLAVWNSRAAKG